MNYQDEHTRAEALDEEIREAYDQPPIDGKCPVCGEEIEELYQVSATYYDVTGAYCDKCKYRYEI